MQKKKELALKYDRVWFFFLILYILIDLGRLQEIFPIASLKIGMIVTLVLIFFLLSSGMLSSSIYHQGKLLLSFVFLFACFVPLATNNYLSFIAFEC